MTKDKNQLGKLRHSLAHLLAAAVADLYPEVKPTIGPAVENGFYYDFDFGASNISEDDMPKIERRMKEILPTWSSFRRIEVSPDQAKRIFKHNPYKLELIEEIVSSGETLTLYYAGPAEQAPDAEDIIKTQKQSGNAQPISGEVHSIELCRGGHLDDLSGQIESDAFKLDSLAGAYWRGDESKTMLTRVYGLAFTTNQELSEYLEQREVAKKRDHRKLGVELGLFTFSDLVGSGLPLFTPRGTVLRELLNSYSLQLRRTRGYQSVSIPHITKPDLYKTSGHWEKFGNELFLVKSQESSDEFVLKPMNCPHHTQIYAAEPKSYRDLPQKYMETTMVYRDEKSGELHGLSRVRSISMDDTHVFAREDQLEDVVTELIQAAQELYQELKMELKFRLSFRDDSSAYLGDDKLWRHAQAVLAKIVKDNKLDFYTEEGEAAFYGPKLDFIAVDSLHREWQVATVQLDFVQPERFGLEYVDDSNERQVPVMVHAALLGSIERFLSVYIEHTAGNFPFWLAPEQVRVLTVNDSVYDYMTKITDELAATVLSKPLKYNEVRFTTDTRNESLGKKIREAELSKVPVILIVGPKDATSGEVSVRTRDGESKISLETLTDFLKKLA